MHNFQLGWPLRFPWTSPVEGFLLQTKRDSLVRFTV